MATIGSVVEGDTVRATFTLYENNLAMDGTGFTVTGMLLTGIDGQIVDTAGKFGWVTQANGTVYFDPASEDFKAERSPYRARVQLTDGLGKIRSYPNDGTAEVKVRAPRA